MTKDNYTKKILIALSSTLKHENKIEKASIELLAKYCGFTKQHLYLFIREDKMSIKFYKVIKNDSIFNNVKIDYKYVKKNILGV